MEWSQHLIHDVSHYRTSPEHLRSYPEFGLGKAPFFHDSDAKCLVTSKQAEALEVKASMLDVIVMLRLGFSKAEVRDWWVEVADDETTDTHLADVVRCCWEDEKPMLGQALPILVWL